MADDAPTPTPRYERIIAMAADEARARGHTYVGVEHLMLAILVEGESIPAQVLRRAADPAGIRGQLEAIMRRSS